MCLDSNPINICFKVPIDKALVHDWRHQKTTLTNVDKDTGSQLENSQIEQK